MRVLLDGDVIWLHGKFPGKAACTPNGAIRFISGVPRHARSCFLKRSDVLWEESRARWYTMDPRAAVVRETPGFLPLEKIQEVIGLLRDGHGYRKIHAMTGVSPGAILQIKARDSAEFWEGK